MNLLEAIDEARGCLDAPPANEAQTCDWAVVPLLRATGYSSREMHAQTRDAGDKLPDYTVLPGDANEWFLEVKMWNTNLDGKPEIQATGYAHTAGKRWAALTNGRVWRVYDDHIPGLPNIKLIAEARLDQPDFAEFLEAIGRGAVTASGMDCVRAWARAKREKEDERKKEQRDRTTRAQVLAEMLPRRLTSEDDELIHGMCEILVQDNALAGFTPSELTQYFCDTTPGIVQPTNVLPGDEYVSSVPLTIGRIGNQGRQLVIDALRQVGITAEASENGCFTARFVRDGRTGVRTIRVVSFSNQRFHLLKKWADPNLLLAYVWFATDPKRAEIVAMTYAEAVHILEQKGHASRDSWRKDGWWSQNCGNEWLRFLEPYRWMTPAKLRDKVLAKPR